MTVCQVHPERRPVGLENRPLDSKFWILVAGSIDGGFSGGDLRLAPDEDISGAGVERHPLLAYMWLAREGPKKIEHKGREAAGTATGTPLEGA